MAANLCCTAPRCMTPTEPIIKRTYKLANRRISSIPEGTDSRYTSTRSENIREIQRLFGQGLLTDSVAFAPDQQSFESSTNSSKHSRLTSLLRQRLSRKKSKTKALQPDHNEVRQAKLEIKSNLLNQQGPDAGGYDSDAAVLDAVDELATPREQTSHDVGRGRTTACTRTVEPQTWSNRLGTHRLSVSLSPPRLSFGSRGLRRSHLMASLPSEPDSPSLITMRLPSFSADRDTSHTWKRGVMESLHIDSPSNPALVKPMTYVRCRKNSDLPSRPLREDLLTPDSDTPLTTATKAATSHASDDKSVTTASPRHSEEVERHGWPKPSFDHDSKARSRALSASSKSRPHFFMRPERRPKRASGASVHLYSMGISHHLRSTSSFGRGLPRSPKGSNAPASVAIQAVHSNVPRSSPQNLSVPAYAAVEHYAVPSTPTSAYTSKRSSQCSTRLEDDTRLQLHSKDGSSDKAVSERNLEGVTPTVRSGTHTQNGAISAVQDTLPDNPSLTSLSESTKSSKISRFKENLESSDTKKSRKRASFVNLFNKTRHQKGDSVSSLDGAFDEPTRLQRAMALTDQNDAAGLLAKAIRDKQVEKLSMYLKGNKAAAQRDIFRQRSSSFSRSRGNSINQEQATVLDTSQRPEAGHRRSTSEALLQPEGSDPGLLSVAQDYLPRAHSTGHLTPEFKTPIFSGPSYPASHERNGSSGRTLSVSIAPTATVTEDGDGPSRRPSFQLNDVPAVFGTPERSFKSSPSICDAASVPSRASIDHEEPPLDLGPWARFPSHTRDERNGSAGLQDNVITHDFAYDSNTMNIITESSENEKSGLKLMKKVKKIRKRTGNLPKSKSMMFGKNLIESYARLFRSPSIEWLHHGRGHRSSISAGGSLENPDLEMLPPIFAPMPSISDRMEIDDFEDPGLVPDQREIELRQLKHRRADHGHSFVDGAASPCTDESTRMKSKAIPRLHQPEETRRIASSPALVGRLTAADGSIITSSLAYARHYESCVYLPPSTSHSNSSRHLNIIQDTEYHRITKSSSSSSPHLIDKMLSSQPTSANVTPLPSPLASPLLVPIHSITEATMLTRTGGHNHSKSVSSVTSLRASSMDLLKTLKESEERERQRALEGLLSQARKSLSEDRKVSSEISIKSMTEHAKPVVDQYEMPGILGHTHNTWPGTMRSALQSSNSNSAEVEPV